MREYIAAALYLIGVALLAALGAGYAGLFFYVGVSFLIDKLRGRLK